MQGMLKSIQGGDASNGTINSGFVKCNVNVNRGPYIITRGKYRKLDYVCS